ncbi:MULTISPECIES: LysR family transcriptional regulator [unclassified Streptomyces]|uniref:LysR family transcriptional regulator n=1 Tax=unclassified Streptomyces TaxID=2593676 RepID=UPI00037BB3DE|nr:MULTISPECIES: LysR family transcriptional regulator [unclassified Streptomyces]MYT34094.1 LysR family transcriptional regulator [Streptomyces sp. SID8354]
MEIRQLRYFLTVAEELHFGRAAERLHIVQSAVSQQLRRLERELGTELFARSTRVVRLTEAGDRLLPYAREMLALQARAREAIDELRAEQAATVRLGTSSGLGERLDTLLATFARLTDQAQLELVTGTTEERLAKVRAGDLDATLLRGERTDPGLEFLPLWQDALMAALPARHELAARETVELSGLAGLPLRLSPHSRNPALHDLVLHSCREAGYEPVWGPEFTNAQDTLAAIGYGKPSWTVFYAAHADQLPVPGVVFRPLTRPTPLMRAYLAVRPGPPRPALRALIEACYAAGADEAEAP